MSRSLLILILEMLNAHQLLLLCVESVYSFSPLLLKCFFFQVLILFLMHSKHSSNFVLFQTGVFLCLGNDSAS